MKTLKSNVAKILLGFVFLSSAIAVSAQDSTKTSFTVNADLVSSYVWRGFKQNNGPNIQPTASITFGGLSIGTWGSTNFVGDAKEVDFYLTYAFSNAFSATLTDYDWKFTKSYFEYDPDSTDHVYELSLNWAGVEKFPLSISLNTMLLGADKNKDGDAGYSTYVELGYPVSANGKLLLGGLYTADESGANAYGLAKKGFNITNIGLKVTKEIKIADYKLPVYGIVGFNPAFEDAYLVAGITF